MVLGELLIDKSFRTRTAMYIGDKNINSLNGFILGHWRVDIDEGIHPLNGFSDFVSDYYGWVESTAGWKNIIFKECNFDHSESVDQFFYLYDQFRKE